MWETKARKEEEEDGCFGIKIEDKLIAKIPEADRVVSLELQRPKYTHTHTPTHTLKKKNTSIND